MFTQFENMFDKIKTSVKQAQHAPEDYANTPQKYTISGRQIQQIKLLSQGAFGFIWLAEDLRTKQQFALKRVICQTEQRLKQARKQKDVMNVLQKSQNIVQFYGGDIISRSSQKVVITIMELCDGGTLFDMLEKRQNKGFSETQLIKIILQVLQGLDSIHSTGYYHRDVKLENVLLGKDKRFKLCDFGSCTKQTYNFAQIHKKDYESTKQEIEGLTTPMYRPPQIVDPYLKYLVNHKADIWMTGCVLYTLSFFIHPFVDSNSIGIAAGTYRFPKYPDQTGYRVSDKIKDLIRHMLTPNPKFRPSAKQLIELLKNWENFTHVPLNSQAASRKKQQYVREQEAQQLNKKCVDFDGDIPIQKLMELQNRLKKTQVQQKTSSFVNKKATQKLKNQNSYNVKVPADNLNKNSINNVHKDAFISSKDAQKNFTHQVNNAFSAKDPFGSVSGRPAVKKQVNVNDLWGGKFSTITPKVSSEVLKQNSSQQFRDSNNSVDFFDNFGGPTIKPVNQNTVNFQEMFAQTPCLINNTDHAFTINSAQKTLSTQEQSKKVDLNLLDF